MNIIRGSNASEVRLIKAIQKTVGANADGDIGLQTLSDIAGRVGAITEPVTLKIYDTPIIIAPDITPVASPKCGLSKIPNSINGGFYAGGKPCSICVIDGKVIQHTACHAFDGPGYFESVIYCRADGVKGIMRAMNTGWLPQDIKWAVGGMGLLDFYNPAAEGFTGKFADVLRKTNHSFLGIKNGLLYLGYAANKTAAEVNALAKKLGLQWAIMLDGGHIAAMNGAESFAKINTGIEQYFAIKAV